MAKGIFRGLALGVTTSLLVACGGGGGGGGSDGGGNSPLIPNPAETLKLTFSADRTSLPLNIAGDAAAIGSPHTSTINLRSNYVPGGGPEGGNCWSAEFAIINGATSGFLVSPLLAGATSGSTTFFTSSSSGNWKVLLTSTDQAGTVTIEVAVPNPDTATVTCNDDKIEIGARYAGTPISYIREQFQVAIGQATGKASQVRVNRSAPGFLFAQNTNGATQLQVQAQVLDEAGQRVADPAAGVRNLYATIVNDTTATADDDALLRSPTDGGSRKWVLARTTNGQADFAVISGSATGTLLIEVVADRFDNNVDNGISEAVRNRFSIPVVISVGQEALGVATATNLPTAVEGRPYATILSATGGVPPYKWDFVPGSVPPGGLAVSGDGVVTGTPVVNGTFRFVLRVSDSGTAIQAVTKEFAMTVAPATGLLAIQTSALPPTEANLPYRAAVIVEGGTPPYKWTMEPTASTFSIDNNSGVVSGTPGMSAAGPHNVVVTVTDGKGTIIRQNFVITVAPPPEATQTENGN